jgi:hypothetical protein
MRKSILVAAFTVLTSIWGATTEVLGVPLLAVDFGRVISGNPTPVQPGFSGMAGAPVEASRTEPFGAYTVTVQGEGFYSAGFNAGNVDPSVAAFYEDYYYHNSTDFGVGVTLSIAGVTPNTVYDVRLWSYDEDNIFSDTPTLWSPSANTSGTSGSITNRATPYPTDLSFNQTTIRVQSTTSTLDIFGTTTGGGGGTRLNGFELTRIPEPSCLLLTTLAGLVTATFAKTVRSRR